MSERRARERDTHNSFGFCMIYINMFSILELLCEKKRAKSDKQDEEKGKGKKQARRCREDEDRYEGAGEKEIKKGEVNYRGGQRGKWQEEREEGERANGHRRSRLSDSVNPGLGSLPHSLP